MICMFTMKATAAGEYKIKWWTSNSKGVADVHVGSARTEGLNILYLFWKSPLADLKSAEQVEDDGEVRPVEIRTKGKDKYLLLSRKAAKLNLSGGNDQTATFNYELLPSLSALKIASNCRSLDLKQKKIPAKLTGFPAMMTCQIEPKGNSYLTFSSLEEAEWFGSEAFEVNGKGERYKVFASKDISILKTWNIAWGEESQKSTATLRIKTLQKPKQESPKSSLSLKAGFSYLNGTFTKDIANGSIHGLQIPVGMEYQQDKSRWFLGAKYNFFLYSLSSGDKGKSNTTSDYLLWAGLEYKFDTIRMRGLLGYANRSLILEGNSSAFDAPLVGADLSWDRGKRSWGFFGNMSQASVGGKYTELNLGLYYQEKFFFQRNQRLQLTTTKIESSSEISNLEADWLTLAMEFEF